MVGRSGKSAAGEEEAAVLVLLASGLRALAGIAAGIAVAGSAHPAKLRVASRSRSRAASLPPRLSSALTTLLDFGLGWGAGRGLQHVVHRFDGCLFR